MGFWLKQSTAVTVKMGPFVDETDGKTAETALTISQADIRLSKNGGAYAQTNNSAGATHDEKGNYGVPLDTTDTNTLGTLRVHIHESGALPVWQDFMVVPANVWDSFFGADRLQVHVDEMTAGIITATVLAADCITAAKVAADVTTEIQSGLATTAHVQEVEDKVDTVDTVVDAIKLSTDNLPSDPADASVIAGLIAALEAKVDIIDDLLDTEVAAILAAVDTEVAAIKAKTDNLPAAPAATGDIPTAAQNADALLDRANGVETSYTPRQALRLILSSLVGKLSGAATTTVAIRDVGDTKNRISATVDADGNRTAVTLDAT